jgi:hypothetical protein
MFHFDITDYLCPLYLQRNSTQTYGGQCIPDKINNKNNSIKVSATSA